MDYREFVCAVEKQMNQKMTGGVKAGLYTAVKNNGIERTGVMIQTPGVNISPTIYLEEYYDDYRDGSPIEEVVSDIMEFYESIRQDKSWDCAGELSYERVKDRIVFKLVNTLKNRQFLSSVPHIPFMDLAIVFYVLLEATDDGTAAMVVSKVHAQQWGLDARALWENAVRNVKNLLPAEFFTMNHAIKEMLGKRGHYKGVREPEDLLAGAGEACDSMYVLTNRLRNNGAACMAYPHIMEMVGDILRTDFYVLPSSVHEVIVIPRCREIKCSELDEMIKDINKTQVDAEEVLSDHAYLYERSSGKLKIGARNLAGRAMA